MGRLWRTGLWVLTMIVLGSLLGVVVLLLDALLR